MAKHDPIADAKRSNRGRPSNADIKAAKKAIRVKVTPRSRPTNADTRALARRRASQRGWLTDRDRKLLSSNPTD